MCNTKCKDRIDGTVRVARRIYKYLQIYIEDLKLRRIAFEKPSKKL